MSKAPPVLCAICDRPAGKDGWCPGHAKEFGRAAWSRVRPEGARADDNNSPSPAAQNTTRAATQRYTLDDVAAEFGSDPCPPSTAPMESTLPAAVVADEHVITHEPEEVSMHTIDQAAAPEPVTPPRPAPRHLTEADKERLRAWILSELQKDSEIAASHLHARALRELQFPRSLSTFMPYFHDVLEQVLAEPVAPVVEDSRLDDGTSVTVAGAAVEQLVYEIQERWSAARQCRTIKIPAGYVEVLETADGMWELRADLRFTDRAEALAQYRRLEEAVADG